MKNEPIFGLSRITRVGHEWIWVRTISKTPLINIQDTRCCRAYYFLTRSDVSVLITRFIAKSGLEPNRLIPKQPQIKIHLYCQISRKQNETRFYSRTETIIVAVTQVREKHSNLNTPICTLPNTSFGCCCFFIMIHTFPEIRLQKVIFKYF